MCLSDVWDGLADEESQNPVLTISNDKLSKNSEWNQHRMSAILEHLRGISR